MALIVKKLIMMITICALVAASCFSLFSCSSGSSDAIKGSWHCLGVRYEDDLLEAKDDQKNDYTAVIEDSNYRMTIYGVDSAGTWKRRGETSTDEGEDVILYTFTDDSGATFELSYFTKQDKLVLMVAADQFVYFERD